MQAKRCPPAPRKANPTQKRIRFRRIVFTLNNYTPEEYRWITESFAPSVTWIIVAKECGENGTPHLQGACILGSQMDLSQLKMLYGFKRAHIETMRGRPQDSVAYCSKQDLAPFVAGTLPSQGKRRDIHDITERIRNGQTIRDLIDDDAGAEAIVKYHRGLTILRSLCRKQRDPALPPCIIWIHGPTGVGKTKCAFSLSMEFTKSVDDIWLSSGGLQWFGGYDGQRFAIFDDFRAKHAPDFSFLLRVTDRYPIRVPFKGGETEWNPFVIFFTCPKDPESCFSTRAEHRPEDVRQLLRRITAIEHYESWDDGKLDEYREQRLREIIQESGVFGEEDRESLQVQEDNKVQGVEPGDGQI